MRKIGNAAMFLGVMAAMLGASVSAGASSSKKDVVLNNASTPRPVLQRNAFGGFGNVSLKAAGRFLNQKQYRKKCRANPHKYGSRKHRSKN